MKKVINGILYDIEKATKIAEYWNPLGKNDAGYVYEQLFVTDKVNYFTW